MQRRTRRIPFNLARCPSRRDLLRSLASLGVGVVSAGQASPGSTRKHKRKHKKRKTNQKIMTNFFGCVDVGGVCLNADQCCSGICTGEKKRKTCQAHDDGACQPGASICVPPYTSCTTTAGDMGTCATTTGNAGYCALRGDCFLCKRDADCEPFYGTGAACAICPQCGVTGGTVCIGIVPL